MKFFFSTHAKNLITTFHPEIKKLIREALTDLETNPYNGKPLQKELTGYWSYAAKRYRIIYKIIDTQNVCQIHFIGPRADVYENIKKKF